MAHAPHRRQAIGALVGLASTLALVSPMRPAPAPATTVAPRTTVIVSAIPGGAPAVAAATVARGGSIARDLPLIDGFVATVPAEAVDDLAALASVRSVTKNTAVRLHQTEWNSTASTGSMAMSARVLGAGGMWEQGYTGQGVDVALIDSGVAPVPGMSAPGKVVNGPDLSFESQADNLRYLDTFGHGTHMAGIIAGNDDGQADSGGPGFRGIAPDARIVNVKVADNAGNTDLSQVLAAIDWVVQHRSDNGLNIRVLNLSFGTDSNQSYIADPLAYAAEVAWRHGIVVVVAAGNSGTQRGRLSDPAFDPFVIAVGADDPAGTVSAADDTVPAFSSRGDALRDPDVVAPGVSIASLRVPGSYIDTAYPDARTNNRLFRGSGTSQATAMVSGAAALLIQQRPGATPDQIKALITSTATPLPQGGTSDAQGNGLVSLRSARTTSTPLVTSQPFATSGASGTLEGARGSIHLVENGVELTGEQDIFGQAFDIASWAHAADSGSSWSGGVWNGSTWSGSSWYGSSWSSAPWIGTNWAGSSWSGMLHPGNTWSGSSWYGSSWYSSSWSTGNASAGSSWLTDSWE